MRKTSHFSKKSSANAISGRARQSFCTLVFRLFNLSFLKHLCVCCSVCCSVAVCVGAVIMQETQYQLFINSLALACAIFIFWLALLGRTFCLDFQGWCQVRGHQFVNMESIPIGNVISPGNEQYARTVQSNKSNKFVLRKINAKHEFRNRRTKILFSPTQNCLIWILFLWATWFVRAVSVCISWNKMQSSDFGPICICTVIRHRCDIHNVDDSKMHRSICESSALRAHEGTGNLYLYI